MDKLTELAEYLIEYEKIDGEDFEKLMNGTLNAADKTDAQTPDAGTDGTAAPQNADAGAPGETLDPSKGGDVLPGAPPEPPVE